MGKVSSKIKIKTFLSILWFVVTFALVAWWWVYSLKQTEFKDSAHRMFFWEGSSLMAFVMVGGGMLIFLSHRDERRHEQLKFFFSNFTHDIKTSISRLQLQAEVLKEQMSEEGRPKQDPVFQSLLNDVVRLDLQLENSLWYANLKDSVFFREEVSLQAVINQVKNDFENLEFQMRGDAQVLVDRRALSSVLRNILQNSLLHGKAVGVFFQVETLQNTIQLLITDNGLGYSGDNANLGRQMAAEKSGRGNGLGLMLSRKLMRKMGGDLQFPDAAASKDAGEVGKGFRVQLSFPRGSS